MAERSKETAVVVSQEEIAEGIFSMWLETKAAEDAKPGQFISFRDRSAFVRLIKKMDGFAWFTV